MQRYPDDESALQYVGFTGHPFAVVHTDGRNGPMTAAECNDIATAISGAEPGDRIYERVGQNYQLVVTKGKNPSPADQVFKD